MHSWQDNARRDAFLWKVLEQFEGLSRWVPEPLVGDAWEGDGKAVLAVRQDDYELLRFTAFFEDAEGGGQGSGDQRLRVIAEWKGEASELLLLSWRGSEPDHEKGLDSLADSAEGDYAAALFSP